MNPRGLTPFSAIIAAFAIGASTADEAKKGGVPEDPKGAREAVGNPLSRGGSGGAHYGGDAETYMNGGDSRPVDIRKIVSSYTNEFRHPPSLTPRDRSVDGPLLGNGDMGVAIGGTPAKLEFYLCKNDFWRLQHQYGESSPLPLGHLSIAIPGLKDASYRVTQDLYTATTTGAFENKAGRVTMTAYVAAGSNRLVLEFDAVGDAFAGTVSLKVNTGRNSENNSGRSGPVSWGSRAFTKNVDLSTGAAAAWAWRNNPVPSTGNDAFVIKPGQRSVLVLALESLFKHKDYVGAAIASVSGVSDASDLSDIRARHEAWWADYWNKSGVSIGDPLIEKHYYLSLYTMGSCSRDINFPPPLYGWTTDDNPLCLGDYHLNYNHQAPFYGLVRANRLEQADPHDAPLLDFMERAAWHCREMYGHEGGIYPVGIGPKGIEVSYNSWRTFPNGVCRVEHGGNFHGQRTNGSYALVNVATRWYCTYDLGYARRVYPLVRLIATFWEHYLTWEETSQRFVIENDSANEGSGPDKNWCVSLALCRMTFELALDMSRELGRDAERHASWEHILKHLSGYLFFEHDGKKFIRKTEKGVGGTAFQHVYPVGDIHLDSDADLLETARNVVSHYPAWESINQTCSFYPGAVRVGYAPEVILQKLRKYVADCRPNGFYQPKNMHGIENCSTVPNTINEMLCMSHKGVIRLFPVWPKNKDAAFVRIRCWGAFLVSASLRNGVVQDVAIVSEKGRDCTVVNPWAPESMQVVRNGKRAESLTGERVTFGTEPGEQIELTRGRN